MIAIARAVEIDAKYLFSMNLPPALMKKKTKRLFTIIRELKKRNMGIIFISHFLEQIYELCDRITILRNGELVGEYIPLNFPKLSLLPKWSAKI